MMGFIEYLLMNMVLVTSKETEDFILSLIREQKRSITTPRETKTQ